MKDILSKKEKIKRATFGITKRIKNVISIHFDIDILIRNGNIISEAKTV